MTAMTEKERRKKEKLNKASGFSRKLAVKKILEDTAHKNQPGLQSLFNLFTSIVSFFPSRFTMTLNASSLSTVAPP